MNRRMVSLKYLMKKIDFKGFSGIAFAVVAAISAFTTAISDKQKTEKMDELIAKVDKLTSEKK